MSILIFEAQHVSPTPTWVDLRSRGQALSKSRRLLGKRNPLQKGHPQPLGLRSTENLKASTTTKSVAPKLNHDLNGSAETGEDYLGPEKWPPRLPVLRRPDLTLAQSTALLLSDCRSAPKTHMSTYIHTYIYPSIHPSIHPFIHAGMHACMHACMHAPTHTHRHPYRDRERVCVHRRDRQNFCPHKLNPAQMLGSPNNR